MLLYGLLDIPKAAVGILLEDHFFALLRDFRGRPTFRSLTASRSFGSISHTFPTFVAFKRFASIIARTLFAVTPSRFAASAVLMIFMAQLYHPEILR